MTTILSHSDTSHSDQNAQQALHPQNPRSHMPAASGGHGETGQEPVPAEEATSDGSLAAMGKLDDATHRLEITDNPRPRPRRWRICKSTSRRWPKSARTKAPYCVPYLRVIASPCAG